jgi:hypothetical protein
MRTIYNLSAVSFQDTKKPPLSGVDRKGVKLLSFVPFGAYPLLEIV